ncbi:hypothetical protein [Bradyrhizobium japonicum]|uniref:hypothetical protein n=1 Tax=Bradyrhizobium japonicum TaxID=375 RepID=UPI0027151F6B|nr:hypothetical protein [Bradyrhizobium japonicum]WLB57472.1 hypothetical protein QIH94_16215 [Bradyrhizobium japonicum]WLB60662.1 hypothetical protein QIH96_29735 [Bradyrhizobium japonicum]
MKNAGDWSGRKKLIWFVAVFAGVPLIVTGTLYFFFPQYAPSHFPNDRMIAMWFGVIAIVLLAVEYADYKKVGKVGIGNGIYTALMSVLALYYLGRAVAEHEIYNVKATYTFMLKDAATPLVGKVLRASSSGFLMFTDNRVMFVPQGEIKQVKATDELDRW